MEKISPSLFEKSVFHIGAGKDINPLLRLGHLSDCFISTNLMIPKDEIRNWYQSQFEHHPDFELLAVEEVSKNAYRYAFEGIEEEGLYETPVAPFDDPEFLKVYTSTFSSSIREDNWLLHFEVRFKPLEKTLRLYYYHGEGLATYLRLSQQRKIACRILITIQTGALEKPESYLDQFFQNSPQPLIWIRGFDYRLYWKEGSQLEERGLYNCLGMKFNHFWEVGDWSPISNPYRKCRAFITSETEYRLATNPIRDQWNELHQLHRGHLSASIGLNPGDILVIGRNQKDLVKTIKVQIQVWYWEDLMKVENAPNAKSILLSGAKAQIKALRDRISDHPLGPKNRIHLIPFCLESEGTIYRSEIQQQTFPTRTYAPYLLDFRDWEELNNNDLEVWLKKARLPN